MAMVPTDPDSDELSDSAATCTACDLHRNATQTFRVTQQRGEFVESDLAPLVTATIHPSAILRAADEREVEMKGLIDDLKKLSKALAKL